MPVSTIPAVLTALVALGRSNLPSIDVYDGPPAVNIEPVALIIGSDTTSGVAATDQRTQSGYGNPVQRVEKYTVPCLALVWSGETDDAQMAAQRAQCFAIVDAFDAALRADKTLGGIVMSALVIGVDAFQMLGVDPSEETPSGRSANALFTVEVNNHLH